MNRKSISLIEILISIALFATIMVFLYQSLFDMKKSSSVIFSKVKQIEEFNNIKSVIIKDILNATTIPQITNYNDLQIVSFRSSNSYHNNFFEYIQYRLIDRQIFRIESLYELKKSNISKIDSTNIYVDKLYENVEKFKVTKMKDKPIISFYIAIDKKEIIFSALSISGH
jgi:nicotinic acid phosphoribosyltransferase